MRCNRPFFSLAAVRRQHNVQSERIQRRQVSTASERSSLACTHSKAVLDHYQQQAGRIPSSQVAPLMYCQCVDRNSLAKNAPISSQIRELLALSSLLSLNIMGNPYCYFVVVIGSQCCSVVMLCDLSRDRTSRTVLRTLMDILDTFRTCFRTCYRTFTGHDRTCFQT